MANYATRLVRESAFGTSSGLTPAEEECADGGGEACNGIGAENKYICIFRRNWTRWKEVANEAGADGYDMSIFRCQLIQRGSGQDTSNFRS